MTPITEAKKKNTFRLRGIPIFKKKIKTTINIYIEGIFDKLPNNNNRVYKVKFIDLFDFNLLSK